MATAPLPAIITPPREPLIDARTGTISRTWFLFLNQLQTNAGSMGNAAVLTSDDQAEAFPESLRLVPAAGDLERLLATGTFTLGLADTGTAGTYGDETTTLQVTVDDKGRATAILAFPLDTDNIVEGLTNLYFTVARARASLSGTPGNIDYDSTTGAIDLDTVPGVAGTYTPPLSMTVDSFGRITAIT